MFLEEKKIMTHELLEFLERVTEHMDKKYMLDILLLDFHKVSDHIYQ